MNFAVEKRGIRASGIRKAVRVIDPLYGLLAASWLWFDRANLFEFCINSGDLGFKCFVLA